MTLTDKDTTTLFKWAAEVINSKGKDHKTKDWYGCFEVKDSMLRITDGHRAYRVPLPDPAPTQIEDGTYQLHKATKDLTVIEPAQDTQALPDIDRLFVTYGKDRDAQVVILPTTMNSRQPAAILAAITVKTYLINPESTTAYPVDYPYIEHMTKAPDYYAVKSLSICSGQPVYVEFATGGDALLMPMNLKEAL